MTIQAGCHFSNTTEKHFCRVKMTRYIGNCKTILITETTVKQLCRAKITSWYLNSIVI